MNILFYISSAIAIAATVAAITQTVPVRALLYLIVSFLASAMVFLALGAPFAAALEIVTYAGAIMVLFVFVVMMLNVPADQPTKERSWWLTQSWIGPGTLTLILLVELGYELMAGGVPGALAGGLQGGTPISPDELGTALYGPYLLGVELASFMLLAGLIAAYHLGRREKAGAQETGGL